MRKLALSRAILLLEKLATWTLNTLSLVINHPYPTPARSSGTAKSRRALALVLIWAQVIYHKRLRDLQRSTSFSSCRPKLIFETKSQLNQRRSKVSWKFLRWNNKNQRIRCRHFTFKTSLTNSHYWAARRRWANVKKPMIIIRLQSQGRLLSRIIMIIPIIRSTQSRRSIFISRICRAPFKLWAIRNIWNKNMPQMLIQGSRLNSRRLWNLWTLINLAFLLRRWCMVITGITAQESPSLATARQWITMLKVLARNWDFQMKWNHLIFLDQFRPRVCHLKSRDCVNLVDVCKLVLIQALTSWLIKINYRRCPTGIFILKEEDIIRGTESSRTNCIREPRQPTT